MRTLIVEDDLGVSKALALNLRARGHEVHICRDGEGALAVAARQHPDVVILDLGLPGIDGLDVLRGFRGWTSVPIVVVSGRGSEAAKVEALDLGADDFLTKPFGMDELLARLRASVRRSVLTEGHAQVVTPDFALDFIAKTATRDGELVHLTRTQWHIVEVLARHAGRLVTHAQLLQEVWGPTYGQETNYLRVFMAQIRRALEPEPSRPRYLLTEPGVGFRLELPTVTEQDDRDA